MQNLKVVKSDNKDQRLVYGEVYAPNRPDVHGEFMREESIVKMAHDFARNMLLRQIDVEHDNQVVEAVQVVESFVARKGDPDFIEGAWVVGVHVNDDATWEAVLAGEINGFSIEALVTKEAQEVTLEVPPVVRGMTSKSDEHQHTFYVSYDQDGNFLGGLTDTVDGHFHTIKTGTVTQDAKGHNHRFSSVDGLEIVEG